MTWTFVRLTTALVAMLTCLSAESAAQSWLDKPTGADWNTPSQGVPSAPSPQGEVAARCRKAARQPLLAEDKLVRDRGWDLVGDFQRSGDIVVIRGTASYDGMCRPRQYQDFVFVRGGFAGTLSPQPMDSRTDGSIGEVSIVSGARISARYARYAKDDALCCPSRTTTVIFEVSDEPPVVRPVSASDK